MYFQRRGTLTKLTNYGNPSERQEPLEHLNDTDNDKGESDTGTLGSPSIGVEYAADIQASEITSSPIVFDRPSFDKSECNKILSIENAKECIGKTTQQKTASRKLVLKHNTSNIQIFSNSAREKIQTPIVVNPLIGHDCMCKECKSSESNEEQPCALIENLPEPTTEDAIV